MDSPDPIDTRSAMRIVDVHSHMLPPSYLALFDEAGVDPAAIDGFPQPAWSADKALAFVDEIGMDYTVLTISSPHIHLGSDERACYWARRINEEFADFCSAQPDRFGFCAVLPTPCVDESIEEARRALDDLGALGVKIPSNANGVYAGDKRFEPLYDFLDEREAIVIIHPNAPQKVPGGCFTAGPKPLFEFVVDTTRTVLDLITSGTLARHPHLKVVVPHAGSYLPLVAARLAGISRVLVPAGMMEPVDVDEEISRLWFDIAGDIFPTGLPALLSIANSEHVMFGADFPYTPAPLIAARNEQLLTCPELDGIRDDVMHANAERLFNLR